MLWRGRLTGSLQNLRQLSSVDDRVPQRLDCHEGLTLLWRMPPEMSLSWSNKVFCHIAAAQVMPRHSRLQMLRISLVAYEGKPGCKRVQYVTFSQYVSGWVFWLSPSSSGLTLAMLRMLRSTILESLSLMVRLIQAAGDSA